jgi:uncharacterized protein (DUF3084 family)
MAYLRRRDEELGAEVEQRKEESQRRDAEAKCRDREAKRRDAEARRRDAECKRRDGEFKLRQEASERLVEETREFNREILLRNEKVYTTVLARLEKMGEEIQASTAQIKSNTEETRAQTQALLRLLDRFGEAGGAAAA